MNSVPLELRPSAYFAGPGIGSVHGVTLSIMAACPDETCDKFLCNSNNNNNDINDTEHVQMCHLPSDTDGRTRRGQTLCIAKSAVSSLLDLETSVDLVLRFK